MQRRFAATILFAALAVAVPHAQAVVQTTTDKQKPQMAAADSAGGAQPVNIKLDLKINDQTGAGEPITKVVTLIVADRASGSIRSSGSVRSGKGGNMQINVDVRPQILPSGALRLTLGLEYNPRSADADAPTEWSSLHEQLSVVLQPGKPLIVSQAADPASDRKITVEITATPLK
jgi:hypothetical protein